MMSQQHQFQPKRIGYSERSDFYFSEYPYEEDQAFLKSFISENTKSIMEIPCGAGRNIAWLAETGLEVFIVDREPNMIDKVSEYMQKQTFHTGNIVPVVSSMECLNLQHYFDLIFMPRDCFQLITQKRLALQALKRIREHMNPDGQLVIDLRNSNSTNLKNPREKLFYHQAKTIKRRELEIEMKDQFILRFEYTFSDRLLFTEVRLRKYSLSEFIEMCKSIGLAPISIWGCYNKTPYSHLSQRMIFHIRKCVP